MRFYKSIFHLCFLFLITGFELLGTVNWYLLTDNCLMLESISLEVDFFFKSSSILFMDQTHPFIYWIISFIWVHH